MFTVSRIYFNPYLHYWVAIQATWRALCLGLRIRHVSRGEGESFVPQKPLNSQGPCSLVVVSEATCLLFWDPRVSAFRGPRTSGSYWGPSCLLSKARVPSVFEVLVPPFRVFLFATQKSFWAPTQILILYNITPIPLKQQNTVTLTVITVTLTVIHYCIIIVVLL